MGAGLGRANAQLEGQLQVSADVQACKRKQGLIGDHKQPQGSWLLARVPIAAIFSLDTADR